METIEVDVHEVRRSPSAENGMRVIKGLLTCISTTEGVKQLQHQLAKSQLNILPSQLIQLSVSVLHAITSENFRVYQEARRQTSFLTPEGICVVFRLYHRDQGDEFYFAIRSSNMEPFYCMGDATVLSSMCIKFRRSPDVQTNHIHRERLDLLYLLCTGMSHRDFRKRRNRERIPVAILRRNRHQVRAVLCGIYK